MQKHQIGAVYLTKLSDLVDNCRMPYSDMDGEHIIEWKLWFTQLHALCKALKGYSKSIQNFHWFGSPSFIDFSSILVRFWMMMIVAVMMVGSPLHTYVHGLRWDESGHSADLHPKSNWMLDHSQLADLLASDSWGMLGKWKTLHHLSQLLRLTSDTYVGILIFVKENIKGVYASIEGPKSLTNKGYCMLWSVLWSVLFWARPRLDQITHLALTHHIF